MEYKVSYREKDKSIQCIISYKNELGEWKTKSKQGFKTQKESKPWQNDMIEKLKEKLELSSKLNEEYRGTTFKEFKEIYLKELALYREPNTIAAYDASLKKFNNLDNKAITDIDFLDIKNIINDMLKEGLNIATIDGYINRLKIFFDVAVNEYKIIPKNILKENKIKLPRSKETEKIKTLTREELDRLINTIKPEKDKMITLIASKCGLRSGELIGLTWEDIDLENMNLSVNKQWKKLATGEYGFGTLKSPNSYRKVPIPTDVVGELENYKKSCIREFKHDRLFIENMTSSMCTRFNYKFKRLGFDISLHDLRHTYATNLVAIGIDFKTIAEYMGDTVEMVIKAYAHFNDDMYEAGRAKINNLL